ncbi:hypothetical protein [Actinomadura sp. 6N118]|uniref:hypothetical protein n=1 Tax=Actinomadura sp. 6N118 TaxID=3375151 RepID=UPI00379A2FF7
MPVERHLGDIEAQLGFAVDHDTSVSADVRFVQLTPRGSGCSVVIGNAHEGMAPGSLKGVQLVVNDVKAARAELAGRGVDVSEARSSPRKGSVRRATATT